MMTDQAGNVLLVVPCFRESGRIVSFLRELKDEFATDESLQVLVVDDGSGVEEAKRLQLVVDSARLSWPGLLPMLALPSNQGKGGAIYAGWATYPQSTWLAFVDADGSCSAKEVKRLLAMRSQGALIASRIKMLGRSIRRHWHRHLVGRIFATLVGEFLHIDVYDSQCGLKLIPRSAYDHAAPRLTLHRFAFDVDLLTALLDTGCPVIEVPIDWHETPGGKVHLFRDSLQMFRDVLTVKKKRLQYELDIKSAAS